MEADHPLRRFVEAAPGRVVVLHDGPSTTAVSALRGVAVSLVEVGARTAPTLDRGDTMVLVVADAAALRRCVTVLPPLGRARSVACFLAEAEQAALLVPRPDWPPVLVFNGRRLPSGSSLTTVRFARPVRVNGVLEQLAAAAAPATVAGTGGVLVATTLPTPSTAPPADSGVRVLETASGAGDAALVTPPDVVLTARPGATPIHEVTGRAPTVVSEGWLLRGPLDEGVLNPTGFDPRPEHGLVDLEVTRRGGLRLHGLDGVAGLDPDRGATAQVVRRLRSHLGVRLSWPRTPSEAAVRAVAGLAMAGVPLQSGPVPANAAQPLGSPLSTALMTVADLRSPLRREEHSVRLRRAALLDHSVIAWRSRLAAAAGIPHRVFPSCSIVLATRRPHQLPFALRQVGKQRPDVEVVLVAHGFEPDRALVRDHLGDRAVIIAMPGDALFGAVLNAGVTAASGDVVVKMDDDDWYGPDFVTDLLLARRYSGADIVGTTAEYVYLEALDRTIRRTTRSERFAAWVAGGTMMLDRGLLRSLGGFRLARKFVDAQLLTVAAAAGGSIYRAHGLGYVLRRSAQGHTWDPGLAYFADGASIGDQWEGFVPSHLLRPDEADVPTGPR